MDPMPLPGEGEFTQFRDSPSAQLRKEARYKCPLTTMAFAGEEGNPEAPEQTVWLANISRHGLAFYSGRTYLAGEHLFLRIKDLEPHRRGLAILVMHATRQLNGDWLVGCRLETPLNAEELDQCL